VLEAPFEDAAAGDEPGALHASRSSLRAAGRRPRSRIDGPRRPGPRRSADARAAARRAGAGTGPATGARPRTMLGSPPPEVRHRSIHGLCEPALRALVRSARLARGRRRGAAPRAPAALA